jgi:hypothetical protein
MKCSAEERADPGVILCVALCVTRVMCSVVTWWLCDCTVPLLHRCYCCDGQVSSTQLSKSGFAAVAYLVALLLTDRGTTTPHLLTARALSVVY